MFSASFEVLRSETTPFKSRYDNGEGWRHVLPSPSLYPTPIYTYPLSYPCLTWMRNRSHPRPQRVQVSPSLQWIFFLIKIKVFFSSEHNVVMHYSENRWWRSMTMVMEKREAESVRYGRRKERTMISECHMKD